MKQVTWAITLPFLSVAGNSFAWTKTSDRCLRFPVDWFCIPSGNSIYLHLYGHALAERAPDLAYYKSTLWLQGIRSVA